MSKLTALKATLLGLVMTVLFAVPALAQDPNTPATVRDQLVDEATPWFNGLLAVIVALFAFGVVLVFARKVAGMIASRLSRS